MMTMGLTNDVETGKLMVAEAAANTVGSRLAGGKNKSSRDEVLERAEALGIPESDHHRFLESSGVAGRVIDPTRMTETELAGANAGGAKTTNP